MKPYANEPWARYGLLSARDAVCCPPHVRAAFLRSRNSGERRLARTSYQRDPSARETAWTASGCIPQYKPRRFSPPEASMDALLSRAPRVSLLKAFSLGAAARFPRWLCRCSNRNRDKSSSQETAPTPVPTREKHVVRSNAHRLLRVFNTIPREAPSCYPYKCVADTSKNSKCF